MPAGAGDDTHGKSGAGPSKGASASLVPVTGCHSQMLIPYNYLIFKFPQEAGNLKFLWACPGLKCCQLIQQFKTLHWSKKHTSVDQVVCGLLIL